MENKIKKLVKLNQEERTKEELLYFILEEIAKHVDEIKRLKINNDPHAIKEIADMVLLSQMMSISEGVSKDVFEERIRKIEGKIKGKK